MSTPEYRKQVMVDGIVYGIAANSALDDTDVQAIIDKLTLLLSTRQNIPF